MPPKTLLFITHTNITIHINTDTNQSQTLVVGVFPLSQQCMGARAPGNFPMASNTIGCTYDTDFTVYAKNTCTH
jgi:hypothetical protein